MTSEDRGRESARQKLTELEREVVAALEAGGYEPYVKGVADGQTYEGGRYYPQVRWSNVSNPRSWIDPCVGRNSQCEICISLGYFDRLNQIDAVQRENECKFGKLTKWQIEHFNLLQKLTNNIFVLNIYNHRGWIPVQESMSVDDWLDLDGHPTVKVYRIDIEFFDGGWRVISHNLPEEHSENISSQRFRR